MSACRSSKLLLFCSRPKQRQPNFENECGHLDKGTIVLKVNGEVRQEGDLNQMIWKIPEMISYLSDYFEFAAGDVIMTGTPSGVGPVNRGDKMKATVDGLPPLLVDVV